MAAPRTVAQPRIQPEVPPLLKAASTIESLVKKPENGGTPMMAR